MNIRFTIRGWAAVPVVVLLLALPVLLPAANFALAKRHAAELEPLLAQQVAFREAQDVASIYEEGQAAGLSNTESAERLEGADAQMDVTLTAVQLRGDFFGRVIARVDYLTGDEETSTLYFAVRRSIWTGWRLSSLRAVEARAFEGAIWR
jgi:hypothetical protein